MYSLVLIPKQTHVCMFDCLDLHSMRSSTQSRSPFCISFFCATQKKIVWRMFQLFLIIQ